MDKFLVVFMFMMAGQYFLVGGLLIWNGNWQLGMSYALYGGANIFLSYLV